MGTSMTEQKRPAHRVEGLSFSEERIEQRRRTLGASEIAAVAGLNPHQSALDVFLVKRGIVKPFEGNEFTEWGLRLEEPVAMKYAEIMRASLVRCDTVLSKEEPWMSATPDRIATIPGEDLRGLECKNKGARQITKYGDTGSDQVPLDVAAQCHWSMIVTGLRTWDIAVLFGGNEFRWFQLRYDAEIAAALQQKGYDFMFTNVEKGIEPDIDGSAAWTEHLKAKFRLHSEQLRDATQDEYKMIVNLKRTRDMKTRFESDEQLLKNQLMSAIGESAGIQCSAGRITWKRPKPTVKVDFEGIAVQLLARLQQEERKALVDAHTIETENSRRFLPTFPKES